LQNFSENTALLAGDVSSQYSENRISHFDASAQLFLWMDASGIAAQSIPTFPQTTETSGKKSWRQTSNAIVL